MDGKPLFPEKNTPGSEVDSLIVSLSDIGDCVGIGDCEIPAAIDIAVLVLCLIVAGVITPFDAVKVVLVDVFR